MANKAINKKAINALIIALICSLFSVSVNAHEAHCKDTDLGSLMAQVKKSHKKLKKSVDKEDVEQIEKWTKHLVELTEQSFDHVPLKKTVEPTLSIKQFKNGLKEMKQLLSTISESAKTGNIDQIENALDKLSKLKKESHKQFRLDCD